VQSLYAQWAVRPRFSPLVVQPNGSFLVSGTSGLPNAAYTLKATESTGTPIVSWAVVTNGIFDSDGKFTNTDSNVPWRASRFYEISVP
jgi:hypothetical protein